MKARMLLAALAGAAALAAPTAPAAARQEQRDWSRTVAQTPQGGYRMGNPEAPVKLVEFVSLTCPHCAHFSAEGVPALVERHVRSGRVSFELRNYFLNGADLVAAAVSRCAAPEDYFALSADILAAQEQWVGRLQAMREEEREEIGNLGPAEGMNRIAAMTGLRDLAVRHGVAPTELGTCLTDQSRVRRLVEMRDAASSELGVTATPSFAVNGRLAEGVHDWAGLEPLLAPPAD